MRHLIATVLLCLGTALAHAATVNPRGVALFSPHSDSPDSGTTKHGSRSSGTSDRRKQAKVPPATEGKDFIGSWIGTRGVFVWIEPGTFQMGSTPETDPVRFADEIPHQVTLTRGFWLLDHEVTQQEFEWIMGRDGSLNFKGPDLPANPTWYSAAYFCIKLTAMDRGLNRISSTQEYRLPTEAEWEYACRAGSTGARYLVDGLGVDESVDRIAWCLENAGGTPHPVKQKKPNQWGLYDMLGNVAEWCSEWYGAYPTWSVTDPKVADRGPYSTRVLRGGSWSSGTGAARSAMRVQAGDLARFSDFGFRPVLISVQ